MLIQMIKTSTGSPNGLSVATYQQNKIYDVPETLALVFVEKMKVAQLVKKQEPMLPQETQVVIKAPEIQSIIKAPEQKNKFKRRSR